MAVRGFLGFEARLCVAVPDSYAAVGFLGFAKWRSKTFDSMSDTNLDTSTLYPILETFLNLSFLNASRLYRSLS